MGTMELIRLFMEPREVALVGVSRRTGRGAFNILENLLQRQYIGKLYPVNPNASEILGVKAYPSIEALPQGIDLAVLTIPRTAVLPAVRDCAQRGIKAVIVVSDGFAEADSLGKELQAELVKIAQATGTRIIGPNSLGVADNFSGFCSVYVPVPQERHPVALICQSGGFLSGFSEFEIGKGIDLGNMCDVDFSDALEYLEDDPHIKVIALHIEGLKDSQRFFQVALRVSQKKPLIAVKTGKSELASRALASHTASLTGKAEVYQALFKQTGIIPADDVDELGDFTKAFLYLPPFAGSRLAILTPTGAGAGMALDSVERYGFRLAQLSSSTVGKVAEFWPPWCSPVNPLDIMTPAVLHGFKKVYEASLRALVEDPGVDAILCIAGIPTLKTIKGVIADKNKPVATWVIGRWGEELLHRVKELGYQAVYPSPERILKALAVLRDFTVRTSISNLG